MILLEHYEPLRPPPLPRMTFEASLKRLDEILAALEGQQVGLDASLKLFEEGVELLRSASAELGRAETKVQMLLEKSGGGFELREMDL
jgi:exodeoxyribonuclease VII small subunit